MNILLITLGSRGDINPFICLGTALKKRGHDVTLVSSEVYQDIVVSAGLNFISCSSSVEYTDFINNSDAYDLRKHFKPIVGYSSIRPMRKIYDIISKFDPLNLVLITTPFMFGAKIANEKLGIPLITICLQPMMFWSVMETPVYPGSSVHKLPYLLRKFALGAVDRFVMDRFLSPEINKFRNELGLNNVKNIYSKWILSTQKNIGVFPEWFAKPAADWQKNTELTGFLQYEENVNYQIAEDIINFLQADSAPIVLTYGTATTQGNKFFNTFIEATRILNKRVLVLTQHTENLPKLNLNREMHVSYIPLQKLLPYTEAVIHHGGIGTLSQSLAAAIPQLIVPLGSDQFDNAARLEKLGTGISLTSKEYSVNDAVEKIQKLLNSNQIRTNCSLYSNKINFSESEEQTCRIIETIMDCKKN